MSRFMSTMGAVNPLEASEQMLRQWALRCPGSRRALRQGMAALSSVEKMVKPGRQQFNARRSHH